PRGKGWGGRRSDSPGCFLARYNLMRVGLQMPPAEGQDEGEVPTAALLAGGRAARRGPPGPASFPAFVARMLQFRIDPHPPTRGEDPMGYFDLVLQTDVSLPPYAEPSDFVAEYTGLLRYQRDRDSRIFRVGKVHAYRIQAALAADHRESTFDVCDAHS